MVELHAWIFNRPEGDGIYQRLCDVFEYSCGRENVDCHIHKMAVPPKPLSGQQRWAPDNHYKLIEWKKYIEQESHRRSGELILLSDSDMICRNAPSMKDLERTKVIGLTKRVPPARHFNAGMLVCRLGPELVDFFQEWCARDKELFHNATKHKRYKRKYFGMNQASLGWMLEESHKQRERVEWYSCADMNCIEPFNTWQSAHFVHVKGPLMRTIQGKDPDPTVTRKNGRIVVRASRKNRKPPSALVDYWLNTEEEMKILRQIEFEN